MVIENIQIVLIYSWIFLMKRNTISYKSHNNISDINCNNNSTNWGLQNWQIIDFTCNNCVFILSEQIEFEDLRTVSQESVNDNHLRWKYTNIQTPPAHKDKKQIWDFITPLRALKLYWRQTTKSLCWLCNGLWSYTLKKPLAFMKITHKDNT